jgi:hypothetical protein
MRTTLTPEIVGVPTLTAAGIQMPTAQTDLPTRTERRTPEATQPIVQTSNTTSVSESQSRAGVSAVSVSQSDEGTARVQTGLTIEAAQLLVNAIDPSAQLLRPAELVIYHDVQCYEFVLDHGTLYIAQSDGTVLYNGVEAMTRAQQLATSAPPSAVFAAPVVASDVVSVETEVRVTPSFTVTMRPTVPTTTSEPPVLTPVSTPVVVPTATGNVTPCATDANGNAVYCGAIPPPDGPTIP